MRHQLAHGHLLAGAADTACCAAIPAAGAIQALEVALVEWPTVPFVERQTFFERQGRLDVLRTPPRVDRHRSGRGWVAAEATLPRRRNQQHQEKRTIGLVACGGPASFRTLHDDMAVGRAQVPPARAAAFSEVDIEKRKSVRHRYRLSPFFSRQVQQLLMKKVLKLQTDETSLFSSELGF
ncbi:hypothetical protein ACVWWO_000332 [Bradyrhizobium sp. F1.13.1]